MRVLIIKPSSLGDVIHALPLLRLLKKAHPEAEVDWVIAAELAPLLSGDPDIRDLVLFERKDWHLPGFWSRQYARIRQLRETRYDWVIDLQGLARSGVIAWLANGAFTIGVDDPREGAAGFYDVRVPRPSPLTHAVDWYLAVAERLGIPRTEFEWLPRRELHGWNSPWRQDGSRKIILNPGARWMNKRWPAEYFAQLATAILRENSRAQMLILGAASEAPLARVIEAAAPDKINNLAGRTTLSEMIEIIRGCDLFVTNDTGPMHIACALARPTIALFGPTEPRRTGPYGQLQNVLQTPLKCVPCMKATCRNPVYLECLRSISPETVLVATAARVS